MIPTDIFLITAGIIALIVASICDLKTREVPDTITYSMIAVGFITKFIYSLNTTQWSYLSNTIIVTTILFGLGLIMYYSKQWGGGDVKLLAGIGAMFTNYNAGQIFSLNLIINLFVVGALYGIIAAIIISLKNSKKLSKKKKIPKVSLYLKIISIIIAITLIILLIITHSNLYIILIITILLLFQVYRLIKPLEELLMYKYYPVSKLTEGDWVLEKIKFKDKVLCIPRKTGITKKEIGLLKKYKITKVLVKEGIAFVPAITIATVLTLFLGNIILTIL